MQNLKILFLLSLLSSSLFGANVITSHKTAGLEFPENSLEGFLYSLELPVQAIEFDVHFTSDGVAVLSHDPVLDKHNCFQENDIRQVIISQTSFKEIQSINCFNKHVEMPYKVPSLESILLAYTQSGRDDIELNFEIKVLDKLIENAPRYKNLDHSKLHIPESEMLKISLGLVREHKIKTNILFTTFSRDLLLALKENQNSDERFRYGLLYKGVYAPLRLGLLVRLYGLECYDSCWWANWKEAKKWIIKNEIDVFLPNWPQLTHFLFSKGFKKHFQKEQNGFDIYPWTLNEKEQWNKFNEYDFQGIITDKPTLYLEGNI